MHKLYFSSEGELRERRVAPAPAITEAEKANVVVQVFAAVLGAFVVGVLLVLAREYALAHHWGWKTPLLWLGRILER